VQETFMRAMERPPADVKVAWRPWLVRVSMNLARDLLRRRKRRRYPGVWLPEPIETPEGVEQLGEPAHSGETPEVRYGLLESARFAFLVALEALTASQRAVLLLRDAFDYSSRETAAALDMSETNVRITLHRARRAMTAYERDRRPADPELDTEVEAALRGMLACIASHNLDGARTLLAAGARSLGDGGGVHYAARKPVVGAEKIVKLYTNLAERASPQAKLEIRKVNGLPALVGKDPEPRPPNAPRFVLLIDLDRNGRVRALYSVIAPDKLRRIAWS
jgi:RNA polymerase sigma factor (sigma-70 family)